MRTANNVKIECIRGNIANQSDMEAVVNAANAQLRSGGGVAGAIHHAAGPGLEEETAEQAPIRPGEAVITGGHRLPNRYVIHCLGPVYGEDTPSDKILGACYSNALRLAEDHGIESVAFPAISTGIFGYPVIEAARVALEAVLEAAPMLKRVRHIRFVLFSEDDLRVHEEVLRELTQHGDVPGGTPGRD